MNDKSPVKKNKNAVRGISVFLALIVFEPHIKEALTIKLFAWQGGYIGLWQLAVIVVLAFLFNALKNDDSEKLDIPFFNKIFKND